MAGDERQERWRELIRKYEQSDETQVGFCKRNEISFPTFKYWLYKFRIERTNGAVDAKFLRVRIASTKDFGQQDVAFFFPGGASLRFGVRTAPEYVANLVDALYRNAPC